MIEQQFSIHFFAINQILLRSIWHVTLDSLYQVWCWETRIVEYLTRNPMEFKDPQLPLLIINFNFVPRINFLKPRWLLDFEAPGRDDSKGWRIATIGDCLSVWISAWCKSREQFRETIMVTYDLFLIPTRIYYLWFFEFSLLFCK